MSTNINISVGDNKLLDQARLQQNASRQAQLEKEANKRLEVQAADARTKVQAAFGKDANGNPLYGVPLAAPSIDRRPAANRFGGGPGMSLGWIFGRIKEQPVIWSSSGGGSGDNVGVSSFYIKFVNLFKVISGFGTAEYNYEHGYDYTDLYTVPADGQDITTDPLFSNNPWPWTREPAQRTEFAPYNPQFPTSIQFDSGGDARAVAWEMWLPVGKGLLLYYYYNNTKTAFNFAGFQRWYYTTGLGTKVYYNNLYDVQPVTVQEKTTEICLLVSENSIKNVTVPEQFRNKLRASLPNYEIEYTTRDLVPFSASLQNTFVNGQRLSPVSYTAYRWVQSNPGVPLYTNFYNLIAYKQDGYGITPPFFGNDTVDSTNTGFYPFQSGYYVTTGGMYRGMVADSNTDYPQIYSKAPSVSNINDTTGFGSKPTLSEIYDTATKFNHVSSGAKASNLTMSINRIPRPTEPLTWSSPEGFQYTDQWMPRVALGYDWANAKYCKDQLIKLGFTPADLMP